MDINLFLFILGLMFLIAGPLVGVMAMRNGNPTLGLTCILIGPTVGPALIWTAI